MTVDLRRLLGTDFTAEQLAVATAPLQPQLVIAGAGSGKTTVMAARVVHAIVAHGIAPGEVLGLTFTNKAAGELKEKVRRALDRLAAAGGDVTTELLDDAPTVSTYHSYAATIVRDHALRIGREPDTTLLTEAARWQLALSVVRRAPGPYRHLKWQPRWVAQLVLALDADLAEHGVHPDEVRAHDRRLVAEIEALAKRTQKVVDLADAAWARGELLDLVEAYRDRKRDLDLVDFGDQVALAAQIANAARDVGVEERRRFRLVLLDEYQDTSVAQRVLLSALFGDGHPVTAVGDPCQAIYGWRGASVGNLLRFPQHFPRLGDAGGYAPDYLLTSFRNDGRVLAVANALSGPLRTDPGGHRPHVPVPPLVPVDDAADRGRVEAAFHPTVLDEAAWVAQRIRALVESGVNRGQVAVLCRRRTDFPLFHDALSQAGLPVEVVGLGGLLEMPEVGDVVAMLEVLADPTANTALVRILTGARYRIGPRDLVALGARASWLATGGEGHELLDPADDPDGTRALAAATAAVDPCDVVALSDAVASPGDPDRYSPEAYERLRELAGELDALRPLIRQPVIEAVTGVIRGIGLDVEIETDPDGLGAARRANLAAFLDAAATFDAGWTAGSAGLRAGDDDLVAFLDYLAAAREREDGLDVGGVSEADTVKLLTVHKAKGLEWDVVAVPCLSAETFPSRQRRPRWTTGAQVLPDELRGDREDQPPAPELTSAGVDGYKDACRADELTEERRLAYVAVTRARHVVLASGHAWNRTRKTACGPSEFLTEIRSACLDGAGEVSEWCEETDENNPILSTVGGDIAWPPTWDPDALDRRRAAAARVSQALAGGPGVEGQADSPLARDVDRLLAEITAELNPRRSVPLPRSLSASQLVAVARDPDGFAAALARPMPRRPAVAARRGTRFHEWVEQAFGQQVLVDELSFAEDDVPVDADLAALQRAFERSPYAVRTPVAVEAPFELALGGRLLRGRIDAVFATDDGGYEVVDWKTGREAADPLQLAVYRSAWARLRGVPVSEVGAAFVYVRTGEVDRPELPDEATLLSLLVAV